jgi:putative MATE family efflux protein
MTSRVTESSASSPASFWRDVSHALRGEQRDYTTEPVKRALLMLAVPMVLEMFMESLFAVVDMFWVSRLGSDAIAIVGLTEAVMTLIYAVAIGISIAATAIVARRVGENAPDRAAQSAAQIMMLSLGISAGLGLASAYFATDILRLMGASPAIVDSGANFARVMLGGNVTVFMIFVINAMFRGAGDAVLAMRTLWLANFLNIVLGPCFIFGWGPFPELGVTGAAVATNLGRGIGVLYQLWHLMGYQSRLRVQLRHFRPAPDILKRVLLTSGAGLVQLLIGTTSWIGLFKILAMSGSAALAGYTITVRVVAFVLLPAWGIASAAATLVGQNLGASHPERADAAVRLATRLNMMLLAALAVVLALFSDPLVRLFTSDPQVHTHAMRALLIVSLALPLYGMGMCLGAAFNGAGDTWTPTRTNFFCLWILEIPLAWILAEELQLGALGVFISVPVACSVLVLWNYLLFRQGKWKLQRL